jgi:hypothetical protein
MALDPEDYRLLQSIAESLKHIYERQSDRMNQESNMLDIARLNARREFLLLTYAPYKVETQLRLEFECFCATTADIVARPD